MFRFLSDPYQVGIDALKQKSRLLESNSSTLLFYRTRFEHLITRLTPPIAGMASPEEGRVTKFF